MTEQFERDGADSFVGVRDQCVFDEPFEPLEVVRGVASFHEMVASPSRFAPVSKNVLAGPSVVAIAYFARFCLIRCK
jgi:hypothetical protein